jgi:hypothetical protein
MSEDCYPREIPMIRSYLKMLPTMEKDLKALSKHMKALKKYHESCAKAANTLIEDLKNSK